MFCFVEKVCETIKSLKARAEGLLDRHQLHMAEKARAATLVLTIQEEEEEEEEPVKSNKLF